MVVRCLFKRNLDVRKVTIARWIHFGRIPRVLRGRTRNKNIQNSGEMTGVVPETTGMVLVRTHLFLSNVRNLPGIAMRQIVILIRHSILLVISNIAVLTWDLHLAVHLLFIDVALLQFLHTLLMRDHRDVMTDVMRDRRDVMTDVIHRDVMTDANPLDNMIDVMKDLLDVMIDASKEVHGPQHHQGIPGLFIDATIQLDNNNI